MGEKDPGSKGRVEGGVVIILSPTAVIAWRESGSKPPITALLEFSFAGRFIGVKMLFPKVDQWGKKKRGYLKLFLALVYHRVDATEHEGFNDTLNSLINSIPKSAEFIGGRDVNVNLGVRLKIHCRAIGPHGIDSRNKKGRRLLGLISANNIKNSEHLLPEGLLHHLEVV